MAAAPALTPQVISLAGYAKKLFCTMPNSDDKISVICLVLFQDKLELNTIVNVNYCKLLAHIFSYSNYCGKHLDVKEVMIDFGGTLFH